MKTESWKTRPTCDRVHIRKNNSTNRKKYHTGRYYARSSTIGLRLDAYNVRKMEKIIDIETQIAKTLLHEVTHWAQYLFLIRSDWYSMSASWDNITHNERVVEKMANEISESWEW